MSTYTMTFVSGDCLGLSGNMHPGDAIICGIVTDKFSKGELELADFNWIGNYSSKDSMTYLKEPYKCTVVVEVRLDMDATTMQNRSAIYHRCLVAVKLHQVRITRVKYMKKQQSGLQCVVCFEMPDAA